MGNYEQLKQAVSDVIKTNGNQEITGAILQSALLSIISIVGENSNNYNFMQFASDAETIFAWALDKGYRFDFPMNVLLK